MKKSTIVKAFLWLLVAAFFAGFCAGLRDKRDEQPVIHIELEAARPAVVDSEITKPEVAAPKKPSSINLITEIQQAQAMLEEEDAGFYVKEISKYSKTRVGKGKKARAKVRRWKEQKLEDFNILLAVENIHRPENGIEIIKLERKGRKSPEGFSVEFDKLNGVATPFKVTYPAGYVLLAERRVLQIGKEFREVIYTPFSAEIDTPEMRRIGREYLEENIRLAVEDLRRRGVKSLSGKGMVVDSVPADMSLVIPIIEHMDLARFNPDDPQLMNEVFVTVAANQDSAYRYTKSDMGARCLYQLMPKTYRGLVRLYPKAGLIRDYMAGAADHQNAAKAALLLMDSDLSNLSKTDRERIRNNPRAMRDYLAATYNGGSGRIISAIKRYGSHWDQKVRPETIGYLKKLRVVHEALNS